MTDHKVNRTWRTQSWSSSLTAEVNSSILPLTHQPPQPPTCRGEMKHYVSPHALVITSGWKPFLAWAGKRSIQRSWAEGLTLLISLLADWIKLVSIHTGQWGNQGATIPSAITEKGRIVIIRNRRTIQMCLGTDWYYIINTGWMIPPMPAQLIQVPGCKPTP